MMDKFSCPNVRNEQLTAEAFILKPLVKMCSNFANICWLSGKLNMDLMETDQYWIFEPHIVLSVISQHVYQAQASTNVSVQCNNK